MITENYNEFKESLLHGEEYTTVMMSMKAYNGIDFETDEIIYQSSIRQHNNTFKDDDIHKGLVKEVSKSKKKLRNYEFNKNHK